MDDRIIDQETFLFIYKNVCIFNGITYQDTDITNPNITGDNYKIIYLINKAVRQIVILTNRLRFPSDLKYLVCDIVNNSYEVISKEGNPETNQNISSMSEAGRSVSFGATSTWQAKYNKLLDQQINDNNVLINKYKLLYKVECPYGEN